jgi:two-component system sensor histidine kinase CreC
VNPKPRGQNGGNTPSEEIRPDEWVSYLAPIVHRLSQPFTALRGTLELARLRAKSVGDYRAAVEKALESADLLAWRLQELRELAEASAPAGERDSVSLDEVTQGVVDDLRPIANSRGVSIQCRLEGGLVAETYREHLYQALLRVVHHAVLRSPEGKTVEVDLRALPDGAQWVIADAGPRFAFATGDLSLKNLFAGQSSSGGMGESVLGLVTAKQFVEAQGGSLAVQNRPDERSQVLIQLPFHPASPADP